MLGENRWRGAMPCAGWLKTTSTVLSSQNNHTPEDRIFNHLQTKSKWRNRCMYVVRRT
jgi:hypothetical protein